MDCVFAVGRGTPAEVGIVVDVCSVQERLVSAWCRSVRCNEKKMNGLTEP